MIEDLMHTDGEYNLSADFEFRGTAKEFFGIWIVNLLLSILTLGIYSAWAKVRTKKYFYQNTYVAGRNFDFHATGKQILIARLIILVLVIASALLSIIPFLNIVLSLTLLMLIPYLLVKSLRFNAHMTSWSNVRFAFNGTTGSAALNYYLYPIIAILTLFTTWPFVARSVQRFHVNGHKFGQTPLYFDSPIKPFYTAMLAAFAWVLVTVITLIVILQIFVAALTIIAAQMDSVAADTQLQFFVGSTFQIITILTIGIVPFGIIPAVAIYQAMLRNTVYNYTILGENHRFYSDVSALSLLWIDMSNFVVVVLSLGLMLPWAHVRRASYLASHTTFVPGGPLDEFVGEITANVSAIGDAYGDIEGFDIGFAV
ncbi:YjgN family protein [Ruegeria arenilitoris]|uniref:YjgN family protein n=1 Tax=Ruegeria arenilitoris TaxID=1173585 RepID=UPI0020C1DCA9|nr:YjgN family protein [Ruegeria arenilitoris]